MFTIFAGASVLYCIPLMFKENRNYIQLEWKWKKSSLRVSLLYIIIIDVITLKKTACYLSYIPTLSPTGAIWFMKRFELEYEISFQGAQREDIYKFQ